MGRVFLGLLTRDVAVDVASKCEDVGVRPCRLPHVCQEEVALALGNVRGPTNSHYGASGAFHSASCLTDGELRLPLTYVLFAFKNVAFVDICDSPFSPGESFTRVGCHRAPEG